MNRARHTQVLLVTLLLLVGCSSKPKLMPTPVAFDGTGIDPISATPPADGGTTRTLFYATDRTPSASPKGPGTTYSNDRDWGLRLGVAQVDLAPELTWDQLHEESLRGKRQVKPTPNLTSVDETGPLWLDVPPLDAASVEDATVATSFASAVQAALAESDVNEIFIFVHGFNTKFDNNCTVAAELHHYLGNAGVFLTYEWPSQASMLAYGKDKAAASYSVRYLRLLLAYLAEQTDARQINILAHSAGAPVAVGAVRELCLMHFDEGTEAVQKRYRIGRLLLVAPDMDLGKFENAIHDEIVGVPETMAIYFSTQDRALKLSAWIYGFARLGEPSTELSAEEMEFLHDHPSVSLIDVAAAEKKHGSWLGHSYFHDDPWVSSDVIMLMRFGGDPESRGLVQMEDKPIWVFPADYPERATAAAAKLYQGAAD